MDKSVELSMEQQFNLQAFKSQVTHMSHDQAQELLVKLYEQMMARETLYRKLLKHEWGLDVPTIS